VGNRKRSGQIGRPKDTSRITHGIFHNGGGDIVVEAVATDVIGPFGVKKVDFRDTTAQNYNMGIEDVNDV
jgi:hypothetical protein